MYKECNVVMLDNRHKGYAPYYFTLKGNKIIGSYKESEDDLYNLYVLSNDEIKKGDWYHNSIDNSIKQASDWIYVSTCKKIIATTNKSLHKIPNSVPGFNFPDKLGLPKPSQEFIELFIKNYNADNPITKVMVEYIHLGGTGSGYVLKLNPYNTINIKTIKDSWSRDEHIADIKRIIQSYQNTNSYGIKDLDKWIEQNL